jgi:hypothetical protein
VYVSMGNGAGQTAYGPGYGNAIVRLSSGDLRVLDFFIPWNTKGKPGVLGVPVKMK